MLATDESNGVALNTGNRLGSQPALSSGSGGHTSLGGAHNNNNNAGISSFGQLPPRTGLGPGILHSGSDRVHFPLEEEGQDQSVEEGEEYDDEFEEEPGDVLDNRGKLLDSAVIPYHKMPGLCMSHLTWPQATDAAKALLTDEARAFVSFLLQIFKRAFTHPWFAARFIHQFTTPYTTHSHFIYTL